jgi:hypothetical protein
MTQGDNHGPDPIAPIPSFVVSDLLIPEAAKLADLKALVQEPRDGE